jgi:hypothetical protein
MKYSAKSLTGGKGSIILYPASDGRGLGLELVQGALSEGMRFSRAGGIGEPVFNAPSSSGVWGEHQGIG